jgi:hypothetical protein
VRTYVLFFQTLGVAVGQHGSSWQPHPALSGAEQL